MPTQNRRITLGKDGEALACAALRRRGYAILATRYRTRRGEIDIVARHGPTLVFVEVKTRTGAAQGTPLEAVTRAKRRRLVMMAGDYLALHRIAPSPLRFDVVAIRAAPGEAPQIDVVTGAFTADDA
jgi:putative endonuclease